MNKILIIDDDTAVLNYLKVLLLQNEKYEVTTLNDSTKAFHEIDSNNYDLLLLDMDMPNVTGIEILKYIHDNNIKIQILVLTGVEIVDLAVSAMKLGAFDYLTKPIDSDFLLEKMNKALLKIEIIKGPEQNTSFNKELKHRKAFSSIITNNEKMINIFKLTENIARSLSSVLIWGESGTGKELIARAIHDISPRSKNKFIAVNAGIFANELFASEFFGHTKGAFSGATESKRGFIEEAHEGTLFLDEIGELSLPIQVKLLRVLQEGEFFRLGSTQNQKVDVRIIAATNKNLQDEIKKGNFRKDLFYRLNMNSVFLPPLRDRGKDITLLSYYFLEKFSKNNAKNINSISDPVLQLLNSYDYPGNIRELMNIINSAVIIESSNTLTKRSLPQYFLDNVSTFDLTNTNIDTKKLCDVEKEHIHKILHYTHGNKTQASKILGISRVNLISKIKTYNIKI